MSDGFCMRCGTEWLLWERWGGLFSTVAKKCSERDLGKKGEYHSGSIITSTV